jgi:histidine ammonia-lyase
MDTKYITIDGKSLTIKSSMEIVQKNLKIRLSADAVKKINLSRKLVEKWINENVPVYGITTGFGEFKDVMISKEDTEQLQKNLILSHSAGVGAYIPDIIVRLMLLFRINSLAKGYSGVRLELLEFMIDFFNSGIVPLVPSQGSVGCSGDLAPLSHLALVMIGEGMCKYNGEVMSGAEGLELAGLKPISLKAKEGLALTNGTQMMSAYLCKSIYDAENLSKLADLSAAFSVEALMCTDKAFAEVIQMLRPHNGQIQTARNLRKILAKSDIMKSHKHCGKVQDSYSIRCVPQVHGAVKDTIAYCKKILETEINSTTDNPLIIPEKNDHFEGGNFHGEPLALIADFLAIAVSELASVAERRVFRLVDGSLSGLPRFLTKHGGLNSGLMIAQYTAAAIVSENKVLCHPASVDSVPTSANQEDHNSMGSIASRKCYDVINNVKKVIAIEFLTASQGLDFLKPLKPGIGVYEGYKLIRSKLDFMEKDRIVGNDIAKTMEVIFDENFLQKVESATGKLY